MYSLITDINNNNIAIIDKAYCLTSTEIRAILQGLKLYTPSIIDYTYYGSACYVTDGRTDKTLYIFKDISLKAFKECEGLNINIYVF